MKTYCEANFSTRKSLQHFIVNDPIHASFSPTIIIKLTTHTCTNIVFFLQTAGMKAWHLVQDSKPLKPLVLLKCIRTIFKHLKLCYEHLKFKC